MALSDYNSPFEVKDFIAYIREHDVARSNLYEVYIPDINEECLLCESTTLPPLTLLTKNVKYMGPARQRALSIDYGGAQISMTFIIDGGTVILQKMHKWIFDAINPNGFYAKYDRDYKKDIYISLLHKTPTGSNEAIFGVKLIDAFPISTGPVIIDSSLQSSVAKLTVNFAYRYWESVLYENLNKVFTADPRLPPRISVVPTIKKPGTPTNPSTVAPTTSTTPTRTR